MRKKITFMCYKCKGKKTIKASNEDIECYNCKGVGTITRTRDLHTRDIFGFQRR